MGLQHRRIEYERKQLAAAAAADALPVLWDGSADSDCWWRPRQGGDRALPSLSRGFLGYARGLGRLGETQTIRGSRSARLGAALVLLALTATGCGPLLPECVTFCSGPDMSAAYCEQGGSCVDVRAMCGSFQPSGLGYECTCTSSSTNRAAWQCVDASIRD
jgi:hypothetical protein